MTPDLVPPPADRPGARGLEVWRIGRPAAEFSPIVDWFNSRWSALAGGNGAAFETVQDALAHAETQPDLIIVLQRLPDEFPERDVLELLSRFPVTRIVCCGGAWCASEGRTRAVWPLAVRATTDEAVQRLELELEVLAGAREPLPLTATREEIFLWSHAVVR